MAAVVSRMSATASEARRFRLMVMVMVPFMYPEFDCDWADELSDGRADGAPWASSLLCAGGAQVLSPHPGEPRYPGPAMRRECQRQPSCGRRQLSEGGAEGAAQR